MKAEAALFDNRLLRRTLVLISWIILAGLILVPAQLAFALNTVTPVFTTLLGGGNAGIVLHSSPTLADIDGDGKLEIIVGTLQSTQVASAPFISVVRSNGSILWERQLEGHVNSSPAVGDINGDGFPEIVVGLGAENNPPMSGGLIAYNRFGTRLWKVNTLDRVGGGGTQPDGYPDGVFASPSIADVNNDGIAEVIFGAWDMRMYVVRGTDGQPLAGSGSTPYNYWPAEMLDTIWSSPAIADLNGDGTQEIIWGGDISYYPPAGTNNGGLLRVFDHDLVNGPVPFTGFNSPYGTICSPVPCATDIGHYGKYVEQNLDSSPAVGDINNDGQMEIVIGSGRAFSPETLGHWVKVFSNQGTLLATLATDGVVFGSPALADINNDGYLDIIAGTEKLNQGSPTPGTLYAWSGKDFSLLWSMAPGIVNGQNLLITSSPVVADVVPSSPGPEILFGLGPEICVVGASGVQLTNDGRPGNDSKPTLWMGLSPLSNSVAVADIDNDGTLEIVAAGDYFPVGTPEQNIDFHGWVVAYRWPGATGNATGAALPWPMFRRDRIHSGHLSLGVGGMPPSPLLSVSPSAISLLHQYGQSNDERWILRVSNSGIDSFGWSGSTPGGVTLSPSSGTVVSHRDVTVTINTTGELLGVHHLGNIVITATSGGNPISGSPAYIPVSLNVLSHVYRVPLPIIRR